MNTKGATPHRLLALFGFGLAVAVLTSNGLAPLITATQSIGLFVVVIIAFEAIPLGLKAAGFRMFLGPRSGANRVDIVLARWIRQSVSQLLPVARVGGDIAGARVLHLRGVAAPLAGASGVGDLTLGVTGQTLLTVVGVMVWWQLTPGHAWAWPVLASAILLLGGLVGFAYVQTRGMFARLARQGRRISTRFTALAGGADALDRETKRLFQRRPRVAADLGLQFLAHL
ncbi:MAG: lysylphosphatidylglycerol synthase domain-containing protein, partial [Pseudomonadota bacterium]